MSVPVFKWAHIVVAACTLEQGVVYVRSHLGVDSSGGGKHPAMDTFNRVLTLGRGRYLNQKLPFMDKHGAVNIINNKIRGVINVRQQEE